MSARIYCLNFVADLRRAVHCLTNGNIEGTKIFLDHAEKIYAENLKPDNISLSMITEFETTWSTLYTFQLPVDETGKKQYAERLLTFSTIIFSRTMNHYAKP